MWPVALNEQYGWVYSRSNNRSWIEPRSQMCEPHQDSWKMTTTVKRKATVWFGNEDHRTSSANGTQKNEFNDHQSTFGTKSDSADRKRTDLIWTFWKMDYLIGCTFKRLCLCVWATCHIGLAFSLHLLFSTTNQWGDCDQTKQTYLLRLEYYFLKIFWWNVLIDGQSDGGRDAHAHGHTQTLMHTYTCTTYECRADESIDYVQLSIFTWTWSIMAANVIKKILHTYCFELMIHRIKQITGSRSSCFQLRLREQINE